MTAIPDMVQTRSLPNGRARPTSITDMETPKLNLATKKRAHHPTSIIPQMGIVNKNGNGWTSSEAALAEFIHNTSALFCI